MNTRTLIHEDDEVLVYEVKNPQGEVVGTDTEPKAQPVTVEDRIAHIEKAIAEASSLADLQAKLAEGPATAETEAVSK